MSYPACSSGPASTPPFEFSQKSNTPRGLLSTYFAGSPAVLATAVIAAVAGDRLHVEGFVNAVSGPGGEQPFFGGTHYFTLFQVETATILSIAYAAPDLANFASGAPAWVWTAPGAGPFTFELIGETVDGTTGSVGTTAVDSFASLRVTNQGNPL